MEIHTWANSDKVSSKDMECISGKTRVFMRVPSRKERDKAKGSGNHTTAIISKGST